MKRSADRRRRWGGRNATVDFQGRKRTNETHRSTTDPEADALQCKRGPGMEAKLCFIGHGLMENRSGLIVDARLTLVSRPRRTSWRRWR